jgi:hypothetical protein
MAQGGGNSNFFQWIYLFYSVNHLLQPVLPIYFIGYFKFIYFQFIDKMYHRAASLLFNLSAFNKKTKSKLGELLFLLNKKKERTFTFC